VTLTIKREEDSQRQLTVEIDVAEERVQKAMRSKARELAREIHLPGFRKGKAPYNVVERRVGREALRAEAADDLINAVVEEALEGMEAEIYSQPALEDMELEPLRLKLLVPLRPKVELGDYRAIRREVEPVTVDFKAVQDLLERMRERRAKIETVERPAEMGDVAMVAGKGTLGEDETIFDSEGTDWLLDPERTFAGLPVVENLYGMSADEEKSFSFTVAEDFEDEDMAGKELSFEIKVIDVKSRDVPELDDEFARGEGDFEDLDGLKATIHDELEKEAEATANQKLIDDFIEAVGEEATVVYPPAAVEMEIDESVASTKGNLGNSGLEWTDYLKLSGQTEGEIRESMREGAEKRLRNRLLLGEVVAAEKLDIPIEEIDAEIDRRMEGIEGDATRDQMRKIYSQGEGLNYIANQMLMDKITERVTSIVTGNAPDLTVEEESDSDEEE